MEVMCDGERGTLISMKAINRTEPCLYEVEILVKPDKIVKVSGIKGDTDINYIPVTEYYEKILKESPKFIEGIMTGRYKFYSPFTIDSKGLARVEIEGSIKDILYTNETDKLIRELIQGKKVKLMIME